jgi:hypothetical protein
MMGGFVLMVPAAKSCDAATIYAVEERPFQGRVERGEMKAL